MCATNTPDGPSSCIALHTKEDLPKRRGANTTTSCPLRTSEVSSSSSPSRSPKASSSARAPKRNGFVGGPLIRSRIIQLRMYEASARGADSRTRCALRHARDDIDLVGEGVVDVLRHEGACGRRVIAEATAHLGADRERAVRGQRDSAAWAHQGAMGEHLGAVANDPALEGGVRTGGAPELDLRKPGVAGVCWYTEGHAGVIMRGFSSERSV